MSLLTNQTLDDSVTSVTSTTSSTSPSLSPVGSPIIFNLHSWPEPDVLIRVFSQEFHVHSVILKAHSAPLRRLLNAYDQAGAFASGSVFKYEYTSVVREDGDWFLDALSNIDEHDSSLELKHSRQEEREAFHCFLCALYNESYTISGSSMLDRIVAIAKDNNALPIISTSIDSCMLRSPALLSDIPDHPSILIQARKLRCRVLFREVYTFAVGEWGPKIREFWKEEDILDEELMLLIDKGYTRLLEMLNAANQKIMHCASFSRRVAEIVRNCVKEVRSPSDTNALFYRRLFDKLSQIVESHNNEGSVSQLNNMAKDMVHLLAPLVKDNTLTSEWRDENAEAFDHRSDFLCITISDEDLPWDLQTY